jgi:ribosomal-protein-alanine N-acetyltransferase
MSKGTIKIETKRLVLRKFKEDDYQAMFDNWASQKEVAKGAGWPVHTDPNDTKGLVQMWVNEYKEKDVFNWIIVLDKKPIGSISVVRKDLFNRTCELGYNIGMDYWNNGYATEAIKYVVDYLFKTDLFDTITAQCFEFNEASIRVLEKNNFKRDGVLRSRYIVDGKRVNLVDLSLLKKEHKKCQK